MKKPTLKDRLEYLGVVLFAKAAYHLSAKGSLRFAAAWGRLTFDILGFRRRVALSNLKVHLRDNEFRYDHTQIARNSYMNFAMAMAEFARLPFVDRDYIERNIHVQGLDNLDEALRRGRGAILVTGHFGSWELMGRVLVCLGYPVRFVVGIQRNPLVQALMNSLRRAAGIEIIDPASPLAVVHSLKANQFVAMLCDQDAGSKGVFVEFLGQRASTPQGAARFSLMLGSPIVPGFIIRTGGTKHRIVIEKPICAGEASAGESAVALLTQAYTKVIETYVKRYPDHWLWAHRRWKTRPS